MANREETKEEAALGKPVKEEKDKHRALLAGVAFFMILISILWALNIKNVFKSSAMNQKEVFDVDKFSQDFQESFTEVQAKMSELKQSNPGLSGSLTASSTLENK